jgi:hypothetical protein
MKILIPVYGFGKSGGQRVLSYLANEFIQNGHEVTFVVPEWDHIPYYPTKAKIVKSKVTTKYGKVISFFINMINLIRTSRAIKCDVAIANYNLTAYVVLFLPRKINKFYYIQAYEVSLCKGRVMKFIAWLTYLLPLKKIVNSPTLLPKYINNYAGVIPAGLDLKLYSTKDIPLAGNIKKVGIIGRKELYKGTTESIKAIGDFRRLKGSNVEVSIAIYVPEGTQVIIPDYRFCEVSNENELATFYKYCDVILAVGLVEDGAFHYPCAEGMAASCLTISNYTPLCKSNNPLYIETFSEDDIISKLNFALSMSQDQINKTIEQNLNNLSTYSWDNVGARMLNILEASENL